MAEEKRDMLDELIDFRRDLKAVQNPLDGLAGALTQDPDNIPTWNPGDYKERPRANATRCARIKSGNEAACTTCLEVCPVNAISFTQAKISISQDCRRCGLCMSLCPNEAFTDYQHVPKKLYDAIAKVAEAHKRCYLTCTRALGRIPKDNEVVLPCVGAVPAEVLFSIVAIYPNVEVYLPYGICDRCRTVTGEEAYVTNIGQAEEWSGRAVGLVMDEQEMERGFKRSYERGQFVEGMVRTGQAALAISNPLLAGAQAVAARISEHSKQINSLQRSLDSMVGSSTAQKRHRTLTQRRQLMLGALQKRPRMARNFQLMVPECDPTRCTMCGECTSACTTNACQLDADGRFSVAAAYCTSCKACVYACRMGALSLRPADTDDLLIPDEDAARRRELEERHKAEVARLKEEGRKRANKVLDAIERLADD